MTASAIVRKSHSAPPSNPMAAIGEASTVDIRLRMEAKNAGVVITNPLSRLLDGRKCFTATSNGGTPEEIVVHPMKRLVIGSLLAAALAPAAALAQESVKIGFVTFLSGPAAAPFGVPAKNAVEFVVEELNAGKGPAPYNKKGHGGANIEDLIHTDEGS